MLDILTISAKLVLLYPWIYTALDAVVCKPYGTLDPWTVKCTCPPMYSGHACSICLVAPSHGTCEGASVKCKGLRKGSLCDTCMGKSIGADECGTTCDNDAGYFTMHSTCRYCNDKTTCSGHGFCQKPNGVCQCDTGWAQSSVTGLDCDVQCKLGANLKPCSGHGTCVKGGRCECDAPYCGTACEKALVNEEDVHTATWCYGNGVPNLEINGECTCACKTDPYNLPMAIDQPGKENFCRFSCPLGSAAHVCGASAIGTTFVNNKCGCMCSDNSIREVSCDTDCAFGGIEDVTGNCRCLFDNQVGTFPSFCRTCKPGYFIPQLGCSKHCVDSVTCQTGYCAVDTANALRVTCRGCSPNHRGDILPMTLQSNTATVFTGDHGLLNLTYTNYLTDDEFRTADIVPLPHQLENDRVFHYSNQRLTVQLSGTDNATILADSATGHVGLPPYRLQPALVFATEDRLYGQILLPPDSSADRAASDLCVELAPLCQAYTSTPKQLYQAVSDSDTSGPPIRTTDTLFVVASHALLPADYGYQVTLTDTVLRGCSSCEDNYYPEPADTPFGDPSCGTFCNAAMCHHRGTCSASGTCVCVFANMDDTCSRCLPNFYPEPGFNVSVPCHQSCFSDKVPRDKGIGLVLSNASTCSNHGVCDEEGHCRCANSLNGPANGYSGDSCENACNKDHDSGLVCSGHGRCVNGQCAQCDEGFFGSQCEVTCSRDDQFLWRLQANGRVAGAINDVPCGTDETCSKLMCNGKPNICSRTYQYTHLNQTVSYKICDASTNATNKKHPLLECTGFTDSTYPYDINTGKRLLGQDHGIYCDVDISPEATDDSSRYGVCAQTLCRCRTMARSVVQHDVVTVTQVASPTAGSACQYTGCERSQFSNVATWTSFCGEYPPPRVQTPSMFLYEKRDQVLTYGVPKLQEQVTRAPQECSHGTCSLSSNNVLFQGTPNKPAPANADAVQGTCSCKQTPTVVGIRLVTDYRHEQVPVNCGSNDGARVPMWPDACCGKLDPNGVEPYFGHGCADHCMCNDAQHWKGTCAIDIGNDETQMGVGCNCRAGYHNDMPLSPRTRLFCGTTCDSACKGIVTAAGEAVTNLRAACPDNLATADSPAQQAGCYDKLLPCSGHGTCSLSNGQCMYRPEFFGNGQADCSCWGNDVPITEFSTAYDLPGTVALYGKDDCSVPCPGAHALDDFFDAQYDTLHRNYIPQDTLDSKRNFITLYKKHICNGHGYCVPSANVVNNMLECTCDGNWGGALCDQKCEINLEYWNGQAPFQEFNATSDSIDNVLAEHFGLHVCGPHATCDSQSCVKKPEHGEFKHMFVSAAKPLVASWIDADVNGAFFTRFWQQWSMAFVGQFSDCKSQYYSANLIGYGTSDDSFIHALPQIVEWHLTRTCDTQYDDFAAHDATDTPSKPPWCCDASVSGRQWTDESFIADFTHGGCPENSCTNFATGRQCTSCVSPAFADYKPRGVALCSGTTRKAPQPVGSCAVCKQDAPHNLMVHPYDVYDANSHHFALDCVPCFSNTHRMSGNLQFDLNKDSKVCNGHGTCEGRRQSFGGRLYELDDVSNTETQALLCGTNDDKKPLLGLCRCTEDFEGPTCAIPKTEKACNNHGVAEAGQCKCEQGYYGLYCNIPAGNTGAAAAANDLEACLQYENINDELVLVECNDVSGNSKCETGLKCQSCPDPRLDENLGCREYKTSEIDAFVASHVVPKRQATACV